VTEEEQRAERVIRAGMPVEAQRWVCAGGDGDLTIPVVYPDGRPGRPAGLHGTFVLVDEEGKAGEPVDVWVHPRKACVAKILALVAGEKPEPVEEKPEPPAEPTPIRHRRGKGDGPEEPDSHGQEENPSALAAGLGD
jgi:hypothetical protein